MDLYATFLFARPSALEGVARLMDFSGSLNEYNSSPSPQIADELASAADWTAVTEDLRDAYEAQQRRASLLQGHHRLKAGRIRRR